MINFDTMEKELIIVDDDNVLLVILEKMFFRINPGLNIQTFSSGLMALDYLKNREFERMPFILVDLYLSDISGWKFLDELNCDEKFDSKVILITSSVDSQVPKKSAQYKCITGFFEKPINFEIIDRINKLILSQTLN